MKARPAGVVAEMASALDEWAAARRRLRLPPERCLRVAALAQALDDDPGSRRAELRALLARGRLRVERVLGLLSAALRPVPVPIDLPLGEDRLALRRLAAAADPATEPALGLLTLSRALQSAGDEPLAEGLLRAALRARPQEVVLHAALGQLLGSQRPPRWPEALECFVAMRTLRPESGRALAAALAFGGRVDEALALCDRLLVERPDDPALHHQRGYTLIRLGRDEEAVAEYRAALRLQPDESVWHHNLGVALNDLRRFGEAEAAIRRALRLNPEDAQAHYNLGVTLERLRRSTEAEAEFRESIRLQPDFAEAHTTTSASRWRTRAATRRRRRRTARPCAWPPITHWHTPASAGPSTVRSVTGKARRPVARPSGSSPASPWPITTSAAPCTASAAIGRPRPPVARPSG
jgi:Flp pilus assembly protein TadD